MKLSTVPIIMRFAKYLNKLKYRIGDISLIKVLLIYIF